MTCYVFQHRIMIQWDTDLVLEYDSSILVRCDRPADYNRTIKFDMGTVAGESQKAALGTHTGKQVISDRRRRNVST